MNLFHPDSKPMRIGYKLADLMILQAAVLLASLPLVTVGTAFSAMHYTLLKLYRNQEQGVWRDYWKSFRSNLRQSIIIWLIYIGIFLFLYIDLRLIIAANLPYLRLALYLLPIPFLLTVCSMSWVFVLQSRYENTIGKTIRHSLLLTFSRPLYTIMNVLFMVCPFLILLINVSLIPLLFFLGFSLPGFLRAAVYSRVFDALENTDWRKEQSQEIDYFNTEEN